MVLGPNVHKVEWDLMTVLPIQMPALISQARLEIILKNLRRDEYEVMLNILLEKSVND